MAEGLGLAPGNAADTPIALALRAGIGVGAECPVPVDQLEFTMQIRRAGAQKRKHTCMESGFNRLERPSAAECSELLQRRAFAELQGVVDGLGNAAVTDAEFFDGKLVAVAVSGGRHADEVAGECAARNAEEALNACKK